MRRLAFCLILAVASTCSAQTLPPQAPAEISDDANYFGFRLLDQIAQAEKESDKNIVLAPLGVRVALAQFGEYLSPEASKELSRATDSRLGSVQLRLGLRELLSDLRYERYRDENGKVRTEQKEGISFENSLFVKPNSSLTPEFLKVNKDYFGTVITEIPLNTEMLSTIRTETKRATGIDLEQIDDGLHREDFALTSATNILCHIPYPFEDPKEGPFRIGFGRTKTVKYVSQTKDFRYLKSDTFQVLDAGCGLYIFLPDADVPLAEMFAKMRARAFTERVLQHLRSEIVSAKLPEFRVEAEYNISDYLRRLGVNNLFDDFGSLKRMTSNPAGAKLNRILQKTYVDFDGERIDAGSVDFVSGVIGGIYGGAIQPIEFTADRPFIFLILRGPTLLFGGAVVNPEPSKPSPRIVGPIFVRKPRK